MLAFTSITGLFTKENKKLWPVNIYWYPAAWASIQMKAVSCAGSDFACEGAPHRAASFCSDGTERLAETTALLETEPELWSFPESFRSAQATDSNYVRICSTPRYAWHPPPCKPTLPGLTSRCTQAPLWSKKPALMAQASICQNALQMTWRQADCQTESKVQNVCLQLRSPQGKKYVWSLFCGQARFIYSLLHGWTER